MNIPSFKDKVDKSSIKNHTSDNKMMRIKSR